MRIGMPVHFDFYAHTHPGRARAASPRSPMTAAAGRREERPMGVLERRLRRLEKQWLPPAETEASRRWRSLFSYLPVGRSTSGGSIVSVSAAGCQKGAGLGPTNWRTKVISISWSLPSDVLIGGKRQQQ